ncbi:MAG: hypothetical protein ACTIA6_10980 [Pseudoclavibacter sp.]
MSLTLEPFEAHGRADERTRKLAAEEAERDPLRAATHRQAATAGIRTGAQAFAGGLVTVGMVAQAVTWGDLGTQAAAAAISLASALVSGALAGAASYALFLARGVPAACRA